MATATRKEMTVHVNGESIKCQEIERLGWGFRFFVDSEMDAFKAAYNYRYNPHGTKVEFAGGAQRWMVTVFNSEAKEMGISAA